MSNNQPADGAGGSGEAGMFADAQDNGLISVNRVAIRLPPFWPDDPEIWFGQAEAQFHVSGIRDDATKFYCVVAQLDHRYAKEIRNLIKNPPATDKYLKLKADLTKYLSVSRQQQITQALSNEELGDRKPSQFLHHLENLAAGGVSDEFMKTMWMKRLPAHVQPILISQTSASLEELADLADKICEATSPAPPFHVAAATSGYGDLFKRIDDLTRVQAQLTKQIAQMSIHRSRGRSTSRRDGTARSKSRGRSRSKTPGMCWYHSIFAERARKCTAPCNFTTVKGSGSQ